MKCQKCEKPATFHITDLVDGKPNELHLCEECAHKFLAPSSDDAAEVLPAMAGLLAQHLAVGETAEDLARLDQRTCPVCGITFLEFRKQGRLGCPHDYVCFAEELEPLLLNIHGETKHMGKVPKFCASGAEEQTQLIRLRREMKDAVADEDYERASQLRDQIRNIEQERDRPERQLRAATIMDFTPINMQDLAKTAGEWLRGSGPESDIVISSRIRLARNLAEFPFIARATDSDRAEIGKIVRGRIEKLHDAGKFTGQLIYVDVSALEAVDRQFLVERQLISREHADAEGARAVVIDQREQVSVMINEEDHLRIQVLKSGLDLGTAWEEITELDDLIEARVTYAYNDRFGYLTACPTNVGTGLRVSVMLHLPALVLTRQIDKVFRSLQKINLAVRGLYGEGSQAQGDFYQVSNQITLGQSEEELTKKVADVVPVIIDYERRARDFLIRESQETLHDRVSRAYGILRTAQTISSEETMHLLSSLRMGVNLGLIRDVPIPTVNKLFVHTQPAHLQKLTGMELDSSDRNIERATYLRRHLSGEASQAGQN